jgi:hypothetical protein
MNTADIYIHPPLSDLARTVLAILRSRLDDDDMVASFRRWAAQNLTQVGFCEVVAEIKAFLEEDATDGDRFEFLPRLELLVEKVVGQL